MFQATLILTITHKLTKQPLKISAVMMEDSSIEE
jgi:hypothetical protein